jgi:valyl-tRNA synthetase
MGADALRFTLITGSTPGNDMNLSLQRVEGNRNFTNKIWNATRYVLSQLGDSGAEEPLRGGRGAEETGRSMDRESATDHRSASLPIYQSLADRWILSRLSAAITDATRLMESFQFGEAGRQAYEFFWNEFCDWYLEISKIAIYRGDAAARAGAQATLVRVLDESLRLLHPFIPFVTEETWGYLKDAEGQRGGRAPSGEQRWPEALIVAPWPEAGPRDPQAEADMALIMDMVRAIRNVRSEYNVKPGHAIAAAIAAGDRETLLLEEAEILTTLARLEPAQLTIAHDLDAPPQALTLVSGGVTAYLPLSDLVDLDAERVRLSRELTETEAQIARSDELLWGPFAQRAPANVVAREQDKREQLLQRAARLRERLSEL